VLNVIILALLAATAAPASANTLCAWNATESACNVAVNGVDACPAADLALITTCTMPFGKDEATCTANANCEWVQGPGSDKVCLVKMSPVQAWDGCERQDCGLHWMCRYPPNSPPASESACETNNMNYGGMDSAYGNWKRAGCDTSASSALSSAASTTLLLATCVGAVVAQLA